MKERCPSPLPCYLQQARGERWLWGHDSGTISLDPSAAVHRRAEPALYQERTSELTLLSEGAGELALRVWERES